MALDESDMTQIKDIITGQIAEALKVQGKDPKDEDDDADAIKKKAEQQKASEAVLRSAIAFNVGRSKFMDDNKRFLPDAIQTVFNAYKTRQYANEKEEADNYRKVILDEIFNDQKNIDILPNSLQGKVTVYKNLPESDKLSRSGEFFELVDTFLALKKGSAQNEFNKPGTTGTDAYAERFAKLGESYKPKGN